MLNGLSLFSGIGGIDVALSGYVRPVAYCEIDPYCQGVLLSRIARGDLGNAPLWDDIRSLSGEEFYDSIDIIYGGFPCQGISVAGKGKGLADERSGLFFEIVRLAQEIQPKFIFLENVPAITSRGGLRVVREIAEMGYDCRWCVISAASIGALHRRERWFLLAYSQHNGTSTSEGGGSTGQEHETRERQLPQDGGETERTSDLSADVANTESKGLSSRGVQIGNESSESQFTNSSEDVADSMCERLEENQNKRFGYEKRQPMPNGDCLHYESRIHWQEVVSRMGRVSDGVPNQVDRIKSLGNAVVPQQVKEAFEILMGIK